MTMQRFLPRELPAGLEQLTEMAFDLRWSASDSTTEMWREVDPELWEATRNPVLILESVSHARLQALADDDNFMQRLNARVLARQHYLEAATWMDNTPARDRPGCIADCGCQPGTLKLHTDCNLITLCRQPSTTGIAGDNRL